MDHGQLMEDKYLNLKQEHEVLKKKCNRQEVTIKRLTTKLTMIDSTLKRKGENGSAGQANGAVAPDEGAPRLDKDTEALIVSLRRQNKQLKQEKLKLSEELRLTQEQLRRKHPNMSTPRRPSSASVNSGTRGMMSASRGGGPGGRGRGRRISNPVENQSRQKEVIEALKQRLLNTENRMQQLHSQNHELRAQIDNNGLGNRPGSGNRANRYVYTLYCFPKLPLPVGQMGTGYRVFFV
jgi:hypothetical protein